MRKLARVLGIVGAVGAATMMLAGCAGAGSPETNGTGITVVTTTTQLDDFVAQVAGDAGAEVTSLLQPGQSVHGFEPTAADLEAIRMADVVIYNGMGLEPWLDDTLESAGFQGARVDASAGFTIAEDLSEHDHAAEEENHEGHDHGGEEDHEGHDHGGEEGHEGHDHGGDEGHEGHDHGAGNPHIWTSPRAAQTMVTNVADGLATADANNADTYRANAKSYNEKLAQLDGWITENLDRVPADERLLVTNHDALTYFNHDYGVTFVGAVIPSWDDNAEPSAAQIDQLIAEIKSKQVPAIFTEQQLSPETANAIADETGVKVYAGENGLYTDALGAEGSAGETYIGSQIHNVTQLMDSWGHEASAAPADLVD